MLDAPLFWYWWILALSLFILEVFAPGAFFLWLGIAAGLVGFIVLVVPGLTWQAQGLIFAIAAVGCVVMWWRFRPRPATTDHPDLNLRTRQYLNRRVELATPIADGFGRIKIDDTTWRVQGPDLPAGTPVVVVGVEGTTLKVKPVAPPTPGPGAPPD
ncbi:MAG: NfeD family protein [Pseudomonadota bacterium]